MIRGTLGVALAVALLGGGGLLAQEPEYDAGSYPYAHLFHNYWAQPANPAAAPAQLYVSPLPTPPIAGRTYITYPPFHPHQYLYQHTRVYRAYDNCGGSTTTTVKWGWNPRCNYYSPYH